MLGENVICNDYKSRTVYLGEITTYQLQSIFEETLNPLQITNNIIIKGDY